MDDVGSRAHGRAEADVDRVDPRVARSRAQALEAARALLLADGWDALTQAKVATASGVSRATVYRLWPERALILHDVLRSVIDVRHTAPAGADLRADLVEELYAYVRELRKGELGRLLAIVIERAQHDLDLAHALDDIVAAGSSVLRRILAGAVADGRLRVDLDLEVAVALLGGPLVYRALLTTRRPTRRFVEEVVDGFLQAFGARPARRRR